MKFQCDRCKTRYSIADEKVRGKILKIRCKNCSGVITVREGSASHPPAVPEDAPPARAPSHPTPIASARGAAARGPAATAPTTPVTEPGRPLGRAAMQAPALEGAFQRAMSARLSTPVAEAPDLDSLDGDEDPDGEESLAQPIPAAKGAGTLKG